MKVPFFVISGAAALAFVSCEKGDQPPPVVKEPVPASFYTTPDRDWPEQEFTHWMSRAELQHLQETNPEDQFFARVEGRNHDGRMEYRALVRRFPADRYDQWAVFWGITEEELFDWELRLLKAGFVRDNMQVCADPVGNICHQIVWLQPAGAGEKEEDPPEPPVTGEPAIAGQSMPAESRDDGLVAVAPADLQPAPAPVVDEAPVEDTPRAGPVKEEKKIIHVVRPGDTLGKIARQKKTTVAALKKANGLKSDMVRIGQKLVVPVGE